MTSAAAAGTPNVEDVLADLGWLEMLDEIPDEATPLVFGLLGTTGTHAGVINDVVLTAAGRPPGGTVALPYTGGRWVMWERTDGVASAMDPELPVRVTDAGDDVPLARGRLALGWWLVGSARTMLMLARQHAVDRVQFGRPIASFQAVRHRLAETLVAIEGAEATLLAARENPDELGCLLGKAAAGQAALTAAKHCQQVLGGIGFTAEHDLHRHVKRVFVLDGLLGSARDLTREAGAIVRSLGHAPRLGNL
ncbi:acyl-CoA dehydrogenase family protein [Mycobacterium sp. CVI_P3]|uniref:Acyl-CoA dehydrogenase family protein n=2 Tax=Mycobacterium pinniadriaticum TaxID=2994102 RepID=A0ABT3SEW0_9MYCO|nr:acyl-CoA dehydrogenase family protein [Mycobacterium pinniadriaticum]MCX2931562.1 acyl-CoA dehydrogenase family protein [Mycobacterium pinniadriaticum]MCX2938046.1 acyl-CoA dehydrogenase family protein [Mycobacterium pinniadriaticum]